MLMFAAVVELLLPISARSELPREIPFRYQDGLIWLKVEVARQGERLNFLLDSGAGASVIDLQIARSLGVQLGKQYFSAVTTGVHEEQLFPGEAGLLGNALLSKFRLTIDEPRSRVIFEKVR